MEKTKYMNPYLAGFLLGLVLLTTIFITGRGLGASGAMKSLAAKGVETIAPAHYENSEYYQGYQETHQDGILKSWLVFEVLGVLIGGFISGAISDRLKFKVEHGPKITNKTRLVFALIGGILFGVGAQFGRGCTSGSALSGMAVLSSAGFVSMLAIFGSGYMFAYFFRKLWLKN
jgi:uncharacterized membrane protein YedE/YeeE